MLESGEQRRCYINQKFMNNADSSTSIDWSIERSNEEPSTGVDLSKILGGQTKILEEKVVKSDKCDSQLLGSGSHTCPPQVNTCEVTYIRHKQTKMRRENR